MRKGEFDLRIGELHPVDTSEVGRLDDIGSNDLNRSRTGTMTTGHFIIQLGHGTRQGNISEFAIHVVSATSRVVPEPDPIVFDNARVLFYQLNTVQNFTSCLLHLTKLMHIIPEFRFGNDWVGCEDKHPVRLRIGVVFRRGLAADHLILFHDTRNRHSV